MIITNLTSVAYWFGPMQLPAGSGTGTLNLDDASDTSLYLIEDSVADMVNTLYQSGLIAVTSYATPFPRPTGEPEVTHGVGSPQGMVYAPQGSIYLRRDIAAQSPLNPVSSVYVKTTGVTSNTGWSSLLPDASSWQPLTLGTSVTHATGYFAPAAAMIGPDLFALSGAVTMTGTVTAGTTLMTLPSAFFPSAKLQGAVVDGASAAVQIGISTAGLVTSDSSWTVANSPYALDGLTFRLV
jgi:hypothetical protein